MSNYRFRQKPTFQQVGSKAQRRLLLLMLFLLLAAALVLGTLYTGALVFKNKATQQFRIRINSNLEEAIAHVNRMAGGVQSNTSIRLGLIRQHIYAMDQINTISIGASGEAGRLIPQVALDALYNVLERYEVAVQTATGNTLELRTLLNTHLLSLQELLPDTN